MRLWPSAWRRRAPLALLAIAVVAAAAFLAPALTAGQQTTIVAKAATDEATAATSGPCLLPSPDMRRQHKWLLFAERQAAVHEGRRNPAVSLERCVTCHVQVDAAGQPIDFADERHFCRGCHATVAIELDCFSCHRSTPDDTVAAGGRS